MAAFSFSIPQNIVFGKGSLKKLPELAKRLGGSKAYIISGPHLAKIGLVLKCQEALNSIGIDSECYTETEGNPSTDTVERAAEGFKQSKADFIIAFGGGSPMDVAKAVAVVAKFGGKITDYEGVGKVPAKVYPLIAIPTTAGTGSEVTAFSVITDHSRNYKLTVGSDYLIPDYAILDPELIGTVPPSTAAACGIDAMIHALESYLSLGGNPFTDMFALKGLQLIGKSIRGYVANRACPVAAENMLLGSLFAGIAFSSARLGDVHAMSHPVSAYFDIPHGVANAILLPAVVSFNELSDKGKYYNIYKAIAKNPVEKNAFTPEMLSYTVLKLNAELGIPGGLSEVGVTVDKFELMADDAMKSGNIAVNPRTTTKADIIEMYKKAF